MAKIKRINRITKKGGIVRKTAKLWHGYRVVEAYELALLGLTDRNIADEMGVNYGTFNNWKKHKLEFRQALMDGKTKADGKVVTALYRNAIGYEYKDFVIVKTKVKDFNEFGVCIKEYYEAKTIPIMKQVQPDTKSQIKWLQSRQPDTWGEKKQLQVQNQLNISIQNNSIDFTDVSNEELAMIKKLGLMQPTIPIEGEVIE